MRRPVCLTFHFPTDRDYRVCLTFHFPARLQTEITDRDPKIQITDRDPKIQKITDRDTSKYLQMNVFLTERLQHHQETGKNFQKSTSIQCDVGTSILYSGPYLADVLTVILCNNFPICSFLVSAPTTWVFNVFLLNLLFQYVKRVMIMLKGLSIV